MPKYLSPMQKVVVLRDYLGTSKRMEGVVLRRLIPEDTVEHLFQRIIFNSQEPEIYEVVVPELGSPPVCVGCGKNHTNGWAVRREDLEVVGSSVSLFIKENGIQIAH